MTILKKDFESISSLVLRLNSSDDIIESFKDAMLARDLVHVEGSVSGALKAMDNRQGLVIGTYDDSSIKNMYMYLRHWMTDSDTLDQDARKLGELVANFAYKARKSVSNPKLVDVYINRMSKTGNTRPFIKLSNDLCFLMIREGHEFSEISAIKELYEKIDEEDEDTKTIIKFYFFGEYGRLNSESRG